ncbi:D-alanyl-D-alanine carboxypeptidase/D-alanyl-D-alanine-endopeptidase [Euzebya tangerina]|uniref:D-alanyl-D-alanine carboxypeptidase/D-alanyl-D-alanine endopeptidase n=1 Tax=Euzebya tangerina TaxID=591198 RepID=UPI000E321CFE|nr:D-alanyl-D-alanine carboxypeptidase/D-alanyl-D-alanine-endopeptidase [Euzebya tangerina]
MAGRQGVFWRSLLVLILVLSLIAAGIWYAEPQLVVGDPLPRAVAGVVGEKPAPLKRRLVGETAKPGLVQLADTAAPVSVPDPPAPDAQPAPLTLALLDAIEQAGAAGQSSVHVMDAEGQIVFDFEGGTPRIPASTSKLVTAAMALTTFGPDHRFVTRAASTTTPVEGVIDGDLVLIGGGDPTLVSRTFIELETNPERPQTPLDGLADQIVAAGIIQIDGGVVGDPSYLQGETLANGWPPNYLEDLDATPITGLTIDQGIQFFEQDGVPQARAAPDPALEAAAALSAALIERGVVIAGEPQVIRPEEELTTAVDLAAVESPPLSVLLTRMVRSSDNHIADTVFRAVGRHSVGDGSFDDAETQIPTLLADLELDWSTSLVQDGSGLSRASTIPAAVLTTLNYRMTNSSVGALWQDLMAVAGESGTLERRLVGSIAELRLRGKTGSLGDVRALSGAVVGPDGQPLYFTVMSNALTPDQRDNARRLQDLVVLALSAELYGCQPVPPPPPEVPAGPDELPPLPSHSC